MAFLFIIIIPCLGFTQDRTEFENVMAQFVRHYNGANAKGICGMFSDNGSGCLWTKETLQYTLSKYGKIVSYKYVSIDSVTDENRITLYKVTAQKKTFMLGFDLDEKKKFGTHRFDTSSPHIDSLLSSVH